MLKCLWLKGYIRNQDEIEALLPSSGSGEKRSAEEVLEAAFSAGDYALLEKLNGSFAFVMHDEEQDLWLATAPFPLTTLQLTSTSSGRKTKK